MIERTAEDQERFSENMAALKATAERADAKAAQAEQALRDEAHVPAGDLHAALAQRDALLAALEALIIVDAHRMSGHYQNAHKQAMDEVRAAIALVERPAL